MEMVHVVLWMIYPYTIMAILGMGLVWQYDMAKVLEDSEMELNTSQLLHKTITILILLCLVTGVAVIYFSGMTNDSEQLFNWTLSLLRFNPDMNVIMTISILSKVYLLLVLTLLLALSFTKYLSYLFIPHQFLKIQLVKKINKL